MFIVVLFIIAKDTEAAYTQVSIDTWKVKENIMYMYNEILFSHITHHPVICNKKIITRKALC